MKRICLLVWLFVTFIITTQAQTDKYFIEKHYTEMTQVLLNSMFGEGNFVARVIVDMTDPQYEVKYTEESNPKTSGKNKSEEKVYILPGVPALKNIAPESLNQMPYNSVTTLMKSRLRKISILIIADKNYPKSQARKAEVAIKQLLSFRDGRDSFTLQYEKFYDNPLSETQTIQMVPGPENYFSISNIVDYIFLFLLLIGIVCYILFQGKLIKVSQQREDAGSNISVNPNLELPEGMGMGGPSSAGTGEPTMKHFFNFVNNQNIDIFITLLKKESLKPELISLVISFLPEHLASKVINQIDVKLQVAVALDLFNQKMASKQLLEKIELKIKSSLECYSGGVEKFEKVFDFVSSQQKNAMLQLIKKSNPAKYKEIRKYILLFDDISKLSEEDMQTLVSDINLDTLSTALVGVDQAVQDFVINNLTKSAKDIVRQYLQIKGQDYSKDDIEKAQDRIVKLIKKFADKGLIKIHEKLI